jgi:GAF domain-containing protein
VGQDAVFFDNPDLPHTRSEMALPLRVRSRVIGVLDVQSIEEEAFSADDVAMLQTLADQVALAIENAHLLEEADDRFREISTLLGRQSQEGWKRVVKERPGWGYTYDGVEVTPRKRSHVVETEPPRDRDAGPYGTAPRLIVPLQVRDAAIGNLDLNLGDRSPTSEELLLAQAVADQAGQALERARLFQETQRVLRETESLYRAGQAIGAATSVEKVGQALIDYAVTSGVDAARILLFEHDRQGQPAYIVTREGWTVDDRPAQPYGTRLSWENYPLVELMSPNEPIVMEDVLTDPRANEATRMLVATVSGLRSFIMVPITVGERWLGVIFTGRNEPSTFAMDLIRGYWTLAGQAAIALESMRLLDETQRRAARERLTREITDKMRRAVDLDTLMQTALQDMGAALGATRAFVQLSTLEEDGNKNRIQPPSEQE